MSSTAGALIWWVIPAIGLIGALLYVQWVTKFQNRYRKETNRSMGQFQRFQDSLRNSQSRGDDPVEHLPIPGVSRFNPEL